MYTPLQMYIISQLKNAGLEPELIKGFLSLDIESFQTIKEDITSLRYSRGLGMYMPRMEHIRLVCKTGFLHKATFKGMPFFYTWWYTGRMGYIKDPITLLYIPCSMNKLNIDRLVNLQLKYTTYKYLQLPLDGFEYFEKTLRSTNDIDHAIERIGISDKVYLRNILGPVSQNLCEKHPQSETFIKTYTTSKHIGKRLITLMNRSHEAMVLGYGHPTIEGFILQALHNFYLSKNKQWWEGETYVVVECGANVMIHHHTLADHINTEVLYPDNFEIHPKVFYREILKQMAEKRHKLVISKYGDQKFPLHHLLDKLDKTKWYHLDTPIKMIAEGDQMHHCVGGEGYIEYARDKTGYYFHYDDGTKDGVTVEIIEHNYLDLLVFDGVNKSYNTTPSLETRLQMTRDLVKVQEVDSVDIKEIYESILDCDEMIQVGILDYSLVTEHTSRIKIPFSLMFKEECPPVCDGDLPSNQWVSDVDVSTMYPQIHDVFSTGMDFGRGIVTRLGAGSTQCDLLNANGETLTSLLRQLTSNRSYNKHTHSKYVMSDKPLVHYHNFPDLRQEIDKLDIPFKPSNVQS